MKIDLQALHAQLAGAVHTPPWIVYPPSDPMGAGIGANHTKYNIGSFEFDEDNVLAVAAVNALPTLIAVYEAACAWRDAQDSNSAIKDLRAAIDAARSGA